jgi:hypothetical protein
MLRCVNDGVTNIKPGHQTTGNAYEIWSDESSFMLFPTSGGQPWKLIIQNAWCGFNSETWGRFYDDLGKQHHDAVFYCLTITLYGRITVGEYVDRLNAIFRQQNFVFGILMNCSLLVGDGA